SAPTVGYRIFGVTASTIYGYWKRALLQAMPLRRHWYPQVPAFPSRRRLWPKPHQSGAERHLGDVPGSGYWSDEGMRSSVGSETARKVAKIDEARLARP